MLKQKKRKETKFREFCYILKTGMFGFFLAGFSRTLLLSNCPGFFIKTKNVSFKSPGQLGFRVIGLFLVTQPQNTHIHTPVTYLYMLL